MKWLQVIVICGILYVSDGVRRSSPRQSPSYLISFPSVLRPRIPVSLSITVLTRSTVRVTTEIVNGNTSVVSVESIFQGGSTGLQVLPAIPESAIHYFSPYMLVVKGYVHDSLVFTNTSFLRFNPKSSSTFIQTDKSVYSPGQLVKIRTVSILPDGKPCTSKVDIVIKDPKRNVILQWLTLDGFLGIVSREFQLSENPSLGIWTIEANVDGAVSEKKFTVDYYVLPRFEVQIKAPMVIYYKDDLRGTVLTQYSYGKPVMGLLTVTAGFKIHTSFMSENKTMEIDGSADFVFSIDDLLKNSLHNERDEVMYVTASVTESLTRRTYNTTTEVTVVRNKYRLTFLEYTHTLRPSLNFSTQLKVCSYNMEPLTPEDQQETVTLTVTQLLYSPWSWRQDVWEQLQPRRHNSSHLQLDPAEPGPAFPHPLPGEDAWPEVTTVTLPVPADGVVPIHLQLSEDVATLNIEARFQDSRASLAMYSSYSSPSKTYIQIRRDHSPAQVGIPLLLTAQSNVPLMELHYLVMSRGQVVAAGQSSTSFTLTPEESWAPQACVVVYTVLPNGEIVNDAMLIPIAQVLRNNVSLSWSRASAKPGEEVTLEVSVTEPGSLVGILVVDQVTKWLKQDNDITLEAVLEELTKYNTDKVSIPEGTIMRSDPYSIFKACNLMVLTDAMLSEVEDIQYFPMFPGEGTHNYQGDEVEELRVRKEFPETWLWLDTNISAATTASLPVTVPDSITSWIASAFVMSENLGLGIVSALPKLTVFQDFFLSLNLPPFIIRGEQLLLVVNLFNYLPRELEVMVIVAESESFEFVLDDNVLSMPSKQTVSVKSQDSTTVRFPIRPLVLGEIPISVKAISSIFSDALFQKLLVKAEGIERHFSKSLFLELAPEENRLSQGINFTFPPDVVPGSERAEVAVVGDILGPSITGLESLILMPYGCGEQNMINFAPNIYVLQYLTSTQQVTEDIRNKATSFMRQVKCTDLSLIEDFAQGYQQELSYQRRDGSFSAFGDVDPSGSTWLSAFVLRCFLQARPFISIDPAVLSRTAAWLVDQQRPDGAFLEPGKVIHTAFLGGLDGPVSLTAYVLITLLEDYTFMNKYQHTVSKALAFLEGKLESGISSDYSLCLVAYALSLANHMSANTALTDLIDRAAIHDNVMFWSSSSSGLSSSWQPRSLDIEMAAYVLLSLFKQAMVDQGIPLLKWLIVQRNPQGGFGCTQDTIIALQALSWYAAFSGSAAIDLSVKVVRVPSLWEARFEIDSTNYLLRQSQKIQIEAEGDIHIKVFVAGRGFALFQLNVFYNTESGGLLRRYRYAVEQQAFDLSVTVTADEGDMDHVTITVCTRLFENQGINQTGMALMEVGLLSGFILAHGGVETSDLVKKVQTPPGRVVLYLDSITHSSVCVHILMMRDFEVALVQDAVVYIYDYYEPLRRAERTYNLEALHSMSTCSFCGDNCNLCGGQDIQVSSSPSLLSHSVAFIHAALLLLFLVSTS